MLKNLILYRVEGDALNIAAVSDAMQAAQFVQCTPTQVASYGWIPPRSEGGPLSFNDPQNPTTKEA